MEMMNSENAKKNCNLQNQISDSMNATKSWDRNIKLNVFLPCTTTVNIIFSFLKTVKCCKSLLLESI